jgi:hypothetical protein
MLDSTYLGSVGQGLEGRGCSGERARGCSDSGEDRDGAAQCVARLSSRRPKGGPGRGCMPGEQAQLGTRPRLLGGGCGGSDSGELVAWPGPHAGVQAYWVREETLGVLNLPRAQAE